MVVILHRARGEKTKAEGSVSGSRKAEKSENKLHLGCDPNQS